MWFCCFSTTYGLLIWMPTLYRVEFKLPLQQSLLFGFITQAAGFVGTLVCAVLIDKIGRRTWFAAAFLLGGALLCFIGYRVPSSPYELLTYISLGAAILGSVAIGLNLYTAELYPTPFRAFASSVGGAWQRVAAAVGPIVVAMLLPGGISRVFLYFGIMALIGGVVTILFALETKQRVLEEIA
jgi:putative MFS transporter